MADGAMGTLGHEPVWFQELERSTARAGIMLEEVTAGLAAVATGPWRTFIDVAYHNMAVSGWHDSDWRAHAARINLSLAKRNNVDMCLARIGTGDGTPSSPDNRPWIDGSCEVFGRSAMAAGMDFDVYWWFNPHSSSATQADRCAAETNRLKSLGIRIGTVFIDVEDTTQNLGPSINNPRLRDMINRLAPQIDIPVRSSVYTAEWYWLPYHGGSAEFRNLHLTVAHYLGGVAPLNAQEWPGWALGKRPSGPRAVTGWGGRWDAWQPSSSSPGGEYGMYPGTRLDIDFVKSSVYDLWHPSSSPPPNPPPVTTEEDDVFVKFPGTAAVFQTAGGWAHWIQSGADLALLADETKIPTPSVEYFRRLGLVGECPTHAGVHPDHFALHLPTLGALKGAKGDPGEPGEDGAPGQADPGPYLLQKVTP